jgi:hypothetical protein
MKNKEPKTINQLSGKYFGALSKDINKKREGFQGIREFISIWRNSMNKPVFENKNEGNLVYDAFKE